MPAILDSLFHKVVDTTSSPIGVEGGGWWEATKWRDLLIQKFVYGQMASIQAVFSSPYVSQNLATSMLSLTSHSCGDSLLAVSPARQVEATRAPMDIRQACE